MASQFGVFVDQYGGIAKRSTFVLDEKGVVAYVDDNWDLKSDADFQALLAALGPKPDTRHEKGKEPERDAVELFSPDEFSRDLKTLSSDEFEGRGIGTRAERK